MNLESWRQIAARFHRPIILTALAATLVGATLITADPGGSVLALAGFPFLFAAGALFTWAAWAAAEPGSPPQFSLADRLLHRITIGDRAVPLFPLSGVGIVLADLAYNWILSATPAIQTEDTIVLLAAATLVAYPIVPRRFARERDFVLLFFMCRLGSGNERDSATHWCPEYRPRCRRIIGSGPYIHAAASSASSHGRHFNGVFRHLFVGDFCRRFRRVRADGIPFALAGCLAPPRPRITHGVHRERIANGRDCSNWVLCGNRGIGSAEHAHRTFVCWMADLRGVAHTILGGSPPICAR